MKRGGKNPWGKERHWKNSNKYMKEEINTIWKKEKRFDSK